tara:strand:+ start:493 stop:771 length:279 start_codon:yes stop_codon:yes gene_type:complete
MSLVNMEDTMIVEGLGTVSFVNGILKVQTVGINSAGEVVETGQIEIPGSRVGDVINGLTKAAQGIQEKLNEDSSSVSTESKKKDSNKGKKKK